MLLMPTVNQSKAEKWVIPSPSQEKKVGVLSFLTFESRGKIELKC